MTYNEREREFTFANKTRFKKNVYYGILLFYPVSVCYTIVLKTAFTGAMNDIHLQTTLVLKNDKFRSLDTANTVTDSGLGLLISWTKKAKINFKN